MRNISAKAPHAKLLEKARALQEELRIARQKIERRDRAIKDMRERHKKNMGKQSWKIFKLNQLVYGKNIHIERIQKKTNKMRNKWKRKGFREALQKITKTNYKVKGLSKFMFHMNTVMEVYKLNMLEYTFIMWAGRYDFFDRKDFEISNHGADVPFYRIVGRLMKRGHLVLIAKKPGGGIVAGILSALGSLGKLGLDALLKGLVTAFEAFSSAWKWLRGISFLKNIKSLLGLARALPIGPIAAALAAAGAIVWGVDKFMKNTAMEPLQARKELEQMYGMKPVLDESGRWTTGYTLPDGKTYKPNALPSKYQDILNAYGPGDKRNAAAVEATKRIQADPGAYEPSKMAEELKGGQQVAAPTPSGTQSASTAGQSPYDVVLGYGKFGKPEDYFNGRKLSQLTVAEALWFGRNVLIPNSGSMNSSAMGAYQIVSKTLQGLVDQGVVKLTDTFNAATQDKAAKAIYDQANKAGTLNKQWAYYIPSYGGTGQRSDPRSFEEARMDILKKEGTLKGTNSVPMSPAASSDSPLQQAADTAADAADKMLTSVAEFIGTLGGKILGPGKVRNLTTTGPDFAKLISEESSKIQNQIAMGEKKTNTAAANIPPAARALKSISPNGSISVVDPNYPGTGGIEKYLGHYRLAS